MSDDMKRELAAIKADIGSLTLDSRRMMASFVNLQDDMSTVKSKMLTKDHFDIIISHMNGFTKVLDDWRLTWAVHEDKLIDQDRRLKRLEGRA